MADQTAVLWDVPSADLTAVWKADHSADPWVCHLVALTVASKAVPSVHQKDLQKECQICWLICLIFDLWVGLIKKIVLLLLLFELGDVKARY